MIQLSLGILMAVLISNCTRSCDDKVQTQWNREQNICKPICDPYPTKGLSSDNKCICDMAIKFKDLPK